jgi:hypothetical protein
MRSRRANRFPIWPLLVCGSVLGTQHSALGTEARFERIIVDEDFPGGYQVEVADVNGDGRPDIIGVGGGTCAWYENPSWKKRIVSTPAQTPGIISSATKDLDGDGKAEIAIAYDFEMNQPTKGKLTLAYQTAAIDDHPWRFTPIADVPSIHRLRWGDIDGDKRPDLAVAPIFGPESKPPTYDQDHPRLAIFHPSPDPKAGHWTSQPVGVARPVMHAIDAIDNPFNSHDDKTLLLTADNLGVAFIGYNLRQVNGWGVLSTIQGAPGDPPKRGSSEVHLGKLKDGRFFVATIEPWHGTEVVVYLGLQRRRLRFGPRTVLDTSLKDGHALWVADVDGDGDDEIFAGYRGAGTSVLAFDFEGKAWTRTVLDDAIAAQDLRGGDLDGDDTPDIVAIGGQTHNIIWYRPRRETKPAR